MISQFYPRLYFQSTHLLIATVTSTSQTPPTAPDITCWMLLSSYPSRQPDLVTL